jgi:hypothetical protein
VSRRLSSTRACCGSPCNLDFRSHDRQQPYRTTVNCLLLGNETGFKTLYLLSPHRFDPTFLMPVRSIVRNRLPLDKRESPHLVRATHVANVVRRLAKPEVLGRDAFPSFRIGACVRFDPSLRCSVAPPKLRPADRLHGARSLAMFVPPTSAQAAAARIRGIGRRWQR